jgi:CRISPR-associated protein Csd2
MAELKDEEALKNRYDFVYVFDVKDGNPNGDPDAGNLPRVDAETGQGIVTDVCLKRKVRNYIELVKEAKSPYDIYIKEKAVLNLLNKEGRDSVSTEIQKEIETLEEGKKQSKDNKEKVKELDGKIKEVKSEQYKISKAREWMCKHYFDVRSFGAVMTTGENCGQVRGAIQFTFGRSVGQIVQLEHSITRMAVTTEREAEAQDGDNRTMGRKSTVPYGLYVAYGFISAPLAKQTGFNEKDLELFWKALINMFENDRSAARGLMSARKLYVFKHSDELGNAPAIKLFDLVKPAIKKKDNIDVARDFSDYNLPKKEEIEENLPKGITLEEKI